MKPPVPITDPRFVYVPSHQTDIRETFRRARATQPKPNNVKPIRKEKKA